jgi:putative ABC transport system permease protein
MRIDLDKWEEIFITITRNKTRSFLTAFGVFWGIFMLVVLMGGSQGVKNMLSATFDGFATNSGFMATNNTSKPYKGLKKGRYWSITNADVDLIRKRVPEIDVITPNIAKWGMNAVYKENKISCTLKGAYPIYDKIETPKISKGRTLNEVDLKEQRKVCVIGSRIYETLFPHAENPCGKFIEINGIYYKIVGVNSNSGNMSINGNAKTSITIPFTTMQNNYNFGKNVDMISYTAKEGYVISDIQDKVAAILKEEHIIHPEDKQAVVMVNAEAMFGMIDGLFKGINILSWMIGLGTLLAGAIGVSNIMMVTVKERTTEIGIRRAIGAKPNDIMKQILSESMVLTIASGMGGICFGVLILQMMTMGTAQSDTPGQFQISFWTAMIACIILILLGMLAGLAPAYRAMAIKPIEAIRDE